MLKAYKNLRGNFFRQLSGNVRICSQFLTCSSSAANELQVKKLTTIPNIPPELSEKSPKDFLYAARWWLDVTSYSCALFTVYVGVCVKLIIVTISNINVTFLFPGSTPVILFQFHCHLINFSIVTGFG
jgi:hypothetical protein